MRGLLPKKHLETIKSFDYQWKHLSEAPYLLSDEKWRENVSSYIMDELESTREDLYGKRVLDAGCGNGRWAYGFVQLGCEVFVFDTSDSGVAYARERIKGGTFDVANVLDLAGLLKLYSEESFDIIWSWGGSPSHRQPKIGIRESNQVCETLRNDTSLPVRGEEQLECVLEIRFQFISIQDTNISIEIIIESK